MARNERLSGYAGNAGVAKVQKLSDISLEELPRFSTGFKEFDRVLGGGVVPGSAILTVSYTHLDVYKRQQLALTIKRQKLHRQSIVV